MRFKEFVNEEVKKPTPAEILAEFERMKKTFDPEFSVYMTVLPPTSHIRSVVYWQSRTKDIIFPSVHVTQTKANNAIYTSNYPFLWNPKTERVENLYSSKGVDKKLKNVGETLADMTDDDTMKAKIMKNAGNWYEIEL
jgi:hypothetical protein